MRRIQFYLIGALVAYRVYDAVCYLALPTATRDQVLLPLLNISIWTTILMVAILFRQAWARYILLGLLLLVLILGLMVIVPLLMESFNAGSFLVIGQMLFQLGLFFLILSKNVRNYVSRAPFHSLKPGRAFPTSRRGQPD